MCDCELPSCSTKLRPKARKPHTCCECAGEIKSGETYELVKGIWDGRAYDFHTCAQCERVRTWYVANCLTPHDCWPCYTQLWNEIAATGEGEREDWIKWANEELAA